ncbi:MAG: polymer-forming cytoskeletal protein [Clostridia bacterium]|nr:polymer-forming cytoskeletal protein [Clostridia bacterium]
MMSKKKSESPEQTDPSEQTTPATILAEGVLFKGDFESKEPILIHGIVQGDIQSTSDVALSAPANFKGSMNASNVVVAGSAEGEIYCEGIASITESGEINGVLKTGRLMMSENSTFDGSLTIEKK